MPAVERSPWGCNWVDLMNQYSHRGKSQFAPLASSRNSDPGNLFRTGFLRGPSRSGTTRARNGPRFHDTS